MEIKNEIKTKNFSLSKRRLIFFLVLIGLIVFAVCAQALRRGLIVLHMTRLITSGRAQHMRRPAIFGLIPNIRRSSNCGLELLFQVRVFSFRPIALIPTKAMSAGLSKKMFIWVTILI